MPTQQSAYSLEPKVVAEKAVEQLVQQAPAQVQKWSDATDQKSDNPITEPTNVPGRLSLYQQSQPLDLAPTRPAFYQKSKYCSQLPHE